MLFHKNLPRFALESAIKYNIQHSGLSGGRCINIGCGASERYKELLSNFDVVILTRFSTCLKFPFIPFLLRLNVSKKSSG